ncbi:hypothetical protein FRC03_008141 [Tulasnella sp. 419]|nr:hypothetical protein FRC03_008141 [Tulasnella sp. 419]
MDLDQFQAYNDTVSQYGALDDTSSVISGYTNGTHRTLDFQSQLDATSAFDALSISGDDPLREHGNGKQILAGDDDLDGGLDDFKDSAVDLPPHACRYVNQSRS